MRQPRQENFPPRFDRTGSRRRFANSNFVMGHFSVLGIFRLQETLGLAFPVREVGLVWQWLRVMDELSKKPPLAVAENVVGLVSAAKGEHYRKLHDALVIVVIKLVRSFALPSGYRNHANGFSLLRWTMRFQRNSLKRIILSGAMLRLLFERRMDLKTGVWWKSSTAQSQKNKKLD